jgi:aryl-alcohol dehydrogenase-like predicted oxidoreductase
MQYNYLGRTGLSVSQLCLGTMNFGPRTSEDDSHTIMDTALDMGINFFDTANRYGRDVEDGFTETIIGRWFAKGGSRREKTVIATKLYGEMLEWPNYKGLSAYNIKHACEASLKRLQTDYIDLYQMHHVDRNTPWEEIWQAMEQLVREGKVLYVGSSNFAGWHIAQANEAAKKRNFMGLVSEQSLYNLSERSVEMEVVPAALEYGLSLIPWSPLAGGILAGTKEEGVRRQGGRAQQIREQHGDKVERYETFCDDLGEHPANVALAWLLHQPAVAAPIIGPRTLEQLTNSGRAVEIKFTAEQLAELDAIWPGYKTSPEQYAW